MLDFDSDQHSLVEANEYSSGVSWYSECHADRGEDTNNHNTVAAPTIGKVNNSTAINLVFHSGAVVKAMVEVPHDNFQIFKQ